MSEFNNLKLDVENEIAVLTISRPAALNALNSETLDELNTALTEIEGRDDIKVVILTGGPDKKDNAFKSFVAGADIAEMVNFTAPEARAFGIRASVPFFKLMNMRQVTIAAVNGFALGGGCEIAMACDIRIASDNAIFGQPEKGLLAGLYELPNVEGRYSQDEIVQLVKDMHLSPIRVQKLEDTKHIFRPEMRGYGS